jgi:L-asparagine transporter-like permease
LLRLREASAMAIGGMIGGGIFSVLGVTIDLAGTLPSPPFSSAA